MEYIEGMFGCHSKEPMQQDKRLLEKNRRVWEILRQSAYEEMTLVVACCTSDDHLWPISGPISWACLECWLRWGADGKPKKSELSLAVPHSGNTTYVLPMRGPSSQADKSGGVLWQPSPIRHWAVVFPLCPYSVDKRPDSGVCHPLCLLSRHGAFLLQYNANVLFRTPPPYISTARFILLVSASHIAQQKTLFLTFSLFPHTDNLSSIICTTQVLYLHAP